MPHRYSYRGVLRAWNKKIVVYPRQCNFRHADSPNFREEDIASLEMADGPCEKTELVYCKDSIFSNRIKSLFPSANPSISLPVFPFLTHFHPIDIIMAEEVSSNHLFSSKPQLSFEHINVVPMRRKLINISLLTPRERHWSNEYYAKVSKKSLSHDMFTNNHFKYAAHYCWLISGDLKLI